MSWLYTIVFTGLMFSSQGNVGSSPVPSFQSSPVLAESRVQDETEKFDQTYPLNANGRVKVGNINGSITVEAWDRNEIRLEYTKTADSKERLADIEIRIDAKPDSFSVDTDVESWKNKNAGDRWYNGGKMSVEYHLMVPRGAALNEVATINGSVTVSNFVNYTKVSAVNGAVTATNLRGTANLSTVNGEVIADFDQLETGSKVNLSTVNGRAKVVIPSDSNATIKVDSLNGSIANDFGLPVHKGKYVGRDLYGRIGSGDVSIRLSSVNGGLTVGRKNDGKNLNPATNLLTQKKDSDEDWDKDNDNDNDEDSIVQTTKMNKDIAKAVKDSAKISTKAVKDAQAQVNNIQPEIAKITTDSIDRAADAIEQSAKIMQSDEFKQKIKDVAVRQQEILAKVADAVYISPVPRVEKKSDSFPVKGVPKVTVDAKGCAVTVRGWDKSEVQYRVVQFSQSASRSPLKITDDHNDSAVTIKVENTNNDLNRMRIEVMVPRKSDLKISTSGEIRLDGVSGTVDLSGGEESINVRDVDGKLQVSSSSGRIRVIGFKGDLTAESADGTINLEGDFQKLKAHASDGAITLTLPDNASANLEATGNEIRGDGITLTRVGGDERIGKYRIGNGGASFQIETEGEIHIRAAGTLRDSF